MQSIGAFSIALPPRCFWKRLQITGAPSSTVLGLLAALLSDYSTGPDTDRPTRPGIGTGRGNCFTYGTGTYATHMSRVGPRRRPGSLPRVLSLRQSSAWRMGISPTPTGAQCDNVVHNPSAHHVTMPFMIHPPSPLSSAVYLSSCRGWIFTGRLQSAGEDELISDCRLSSPYTSRAGPSTNRWSQQCASRFNPTCPEPTQWHNCGYAIQYGGCDIRSGTTA